MRSPRTTPTQLRSRLLINCGRSPHSFHCIYNGPNGPSFFHSYNCSLVELFTPSKSKFDEDTLTHTQVSVIIKISSTEGQQTSFIINPLNQTCCAKYQIWKLCRKWCYRINHDMLDKDTVQLTLNSFLPLSVLTNNISYRCKHIPQWSLTTLKFITQLKTCSLKTVIKLWN